MDHGRFEQYFDGNLKIVTFFYIAFNLYNFFVARNLKRLRDSAMDSSKQIDTSL